MRVAMLFPVSRYPILESKFQNPLFFTLIVSLISVYFRFNVVLFLIFKEISQRVD